MSKSFYKDPEYKIKQSESTKDLWSKGIYNKLLKPFTLKKCLNPVCNKEFQVKPYNPKIYCSRSCAATANNPKRTKSYPLCQSCNQELRQLRNKFCSNKCQGNYQYKIYIQSWKQDKVNGLRGIKTQVISKHITRYYIEKYRETCFICGWKKIHPSTGKVPLEIDHIDGNSQNNREENLRLICPNCHSLTPNFRNLNKGKGRSWRGQSSSNYSKEL